MNRFGVGFLTLLATLLIASAAGAACPVTTGSCNANFAASTLPAGGATCRSDASLGANSASYGYDFRIGRFESAANTPYSGIEGVSAETRGLERFTVLGPAPGTPFTIRARLRVTGSLTPISSTPCCGQAYALLGRSGHDPVERSWGSAVPQSIDETLEIPLSVVASGTFELRIHLGCGASDGGRASVVGLLDFADLPPGSFLLSCRGYTQDGPTASPANSWGSLKAHYR